MQRVVCWPSGGAGGEQAEGTEPGEAPDDDDALDLIGNPDLELEDLPEFVQEGLDEIDDIVSLTDCSSAVVGLRVPLPEGWDCRGLDQPAGGMDAFTLFTDRNTLLVTFGSGRGTFACEMLGGCPTDAVYPLSDNFPDTFQYPLGPATEIAGRHASVDAYVYIQSNDDLTDSEVTTSAAILDSAEPFAG